MALVATSLVTAISVKLFCRFKALPLLWLPPQQ
jgi:hypothetical protein